MQQNTNTAQTTAVAKKTTQGKMPVVQNNNQPVQRRNALEVLEEQRNKLGLALKESEDLLRVLNKSEQDKFRTNFLDLATNDYLISQVDGRELVKFAVEITRNGLSIAKHAKEVYIIPFECTIQKTKIMIPQSVIPLNGMQEIAYQSKFFLQVYAVYNFGNGVYASEKGMPRELQAQLNTSNVKWVEEHFIGFDVEILDLENVLPPQTRFVELAYLKTVTKQIQDSMKLHQIQIYRHKAVRRALGDMMIPASRRLEKFDKIELLNDELLDKYNPESLSKEYLKSITPEIVNTIKSLGLDVIKDGEYVYVSGNTANQAKILSGLGFVKDGKMWKMFANDSVTLDATGVEQTTVVESEGSLFDEPMFKNIEDLKQAVQELGLEMSDPTDNGKGKTFVKIMANPFDIKEDLFSRLSQYGFGVVGNNCIRQVNDLM